MKVGLVRVATGVSHSAGGGENVEPLLGGAVVGMDRDAGCEPQAIELAP